MDVDALTVFHAGTVRKSAEACTFTLAPVEIHTVTMWTGLPVQEHATLWSTEKGREVETSMIQSSHEKAAWHLNTRTCNEKAASAALDKDTGRQVAHMNARTDAEIQRCCELAC